MGVSARAERNKIRRRMQVMKMSDIFENKQYPENITTEETICPHCGFKARYKFIRCPQCGEARK